MSTDDPTPAPATPAGPPAPGFPPPGGAAAPEAPYPGAAPAGPYPAVPATPYAAPAAAYPAPPAFGQPPAGPYGSPYGPGGPVPPAAPGGGKGFAITALVLALVALVLSWVPIINNLAAVLAVAGVVFGVVALVGALRRGRPGKAMAISAIAVAVIAFVVVIVTQIAYTRVIDDVVDDLNESVAELEEETRTGRAGAGDSEPTAEAPAAATAQDLAVLSVAFGQNEYDPTTWWYVAVVDNPNPEHVFPFAGFTVEAVGADGTILDSSPDYVDLLPGQTALTGTFYSVGATAVDHVEVRGPQASEAVHQTDLGTFAVADVAATSDSWSTTVGGTLTSAFAEDQELVTVVVVATAPDGTVLGADLTYVDRLPAGGQARFEAMFFSPLPEGTTYTAFPHL